MSEYAFIAALTLIFVVAASFLLLASRYSLPPIPFYLLAGVVVGVAIDETQLLELAQWGIAFAVFAFAVELEPLEGGGLRVDGTIVSVVQLLVTGAASYGLALLLGLSGLNAVYFAIAATLSSSLVALDLLERRVRLRSLHERLAESIHFVEDAAAILVVLALSAVVYADGSLAVAAGGVALIAAGVFVRYVVFERITAFAGGDVEILMLTGVSLLIGGVAAAEYVGVSIVVGAFAAGIAVASTYPHDVETIDAIGSLEDFFSPILFVTLGALVSVPTAETIGVSAALVLAVVVINPLITYLVLRRRSYDSRTALLTGTDLDQVSEFALIVVIEALIAGAIAPDLFDAIILAAIVTMFVSTGTTRYGDEAYRRLVEAGLLDPDRGAVRSRSNVPQGIEDHVIITGYDREGQQVVEACEASGREYVVVESDPTRREAVRDHCEHYVFGDVMAELTWEIAGAERAALIVATVPRHAWAERVLAFDVEADTIVRAVDVDSGSTLLERGALFVAIPDELAADQLREDVVAYLEGELSREELREESRERLQRAVEYGPSDLVRLD